MRRRMYVLSFLLLFLSFCAAGEEVTLREIPPAYPVSNETQALLEVAKGELGYQEESSGFTKYGAWYGDPQAEWCAEFLCWSVAQVEEQLGIPLLNERFPLYGTTNIGRNWFLKQGRYVARTGFVLGWGSQWFKDQATQMQRNSYIPQPGDWVFFSYTPSGDTTHVAMVEACYLDPEDKVFLQVLEGNMPDRVQRTLYALDDWRIQGYGTVNDVADIVLRGGAESKKVAALQDQLILMGLLPANQPTGLYDRATQEAVRVFQGTARLPQTGIANQQTQLRLAAAARQWVMDHSEFWVVDGQD